MSFMLLLALGLQAVAVVLLRHRLGKVWLRHPVTCLVAVAIIYSGVSEILLAIPSIRIWDSYRLGTSQHYIDKAALFMSAGLVLLVVGYLLARPERVSLGRSNDGLVGIIRILDWRLCAFGCIPLALLTYKGRGFNSGLAPGTATVSTNLVSEFLVVVVALTAFSFLLRYGMRWFVPVLVVQSVLLAATGERLPVVTGIVVLLSLLARVDRRPTRKQIVMTLALTVVAVLGITGYRAVSGHSLYRQNVSLTTRAKAIGVGLYTLTHTSDQNGTGAGLIAQIAVRFDGNAFAGDVMQGFSEHNAPLGMAPVPQSTLVVVPSAAWSSKLAHSALNPALTEFNYFGIQPIKGIWAGPVTTMLGLYLGFLGPWKLMWFLTVLGVVAGWAERYLLGQVTVTRLIFLAAAVQAALAYEAGLPTMLVALRTGAALALIGKAIEIAWSRIEKQRASSSTVAPYTIVHR